MWDGRSRSHDELALPRTVAQTNCDLEIDWAHLELALTGLGSEWGDTTMSYPIEGYLCTKHGLSFAADYVGIPPPDPCTRPVATRLGP
jgi:hypothetical protein